MAVERLSAPRLLEVARVADLETQSPDDQWLINPVWGRHAIGIVGGHPKAAKSWFGIDMATSIASGTPCLGRFPVERRGPALIYLAEDDLPVVRSRIESVCRHRHIDLEPLELHVITEPVLRLDLEEDQQRLAATIDNLRPVLVVLDPLIRLHRLDENRSNEISGLLAYFRGLQRTFDCAVVIVHHTSKKQRRTPGQSLRGSSDLHAFGASNAYLARQNDNRILLQLEHRAAPTPGPIWLRLAVDPGKELAYLEVDALTEADLPSSSLAHDVLQALRESAQPLTGQELRRRLRVNNQRLGQTLKNLAKDGRIASVHGGWSLVEVEIRSNKPDARQTSLFEE